MTLVRVSLQQRTFYCASVL